MKTYDVSRLPSSITLGWDGENNWRPIAFDCSAMLFGHSDAAVTLWLLPNGESQAFPVALERDGDTVVWTSDVDANVWEPGVYGWTESGDSEYGQKPQSGDWHGNRRTIRNAAAGDGSDIIKNMSYIIK